VIAVYLCMIVRDRATNLELSKAINQLLPCVTKSLGGAFKRVGNFVQIAFDVCARANIL
jgi:hypothetical protein